MSDSVELVHKVYGKGWIWLAEGSYTLDELKGIITAMERQQEALRNSLVSTLPPSRE